MPPNPAVRKARDFYFLTLTCEGSPHGVGKSPTSIPESKQDTERNFFNVVKGIYKLTATIPFSPETFKNISLKSLCSRDRVKDIHHHCLISVVYQVAEPAQCYGLNSVPSKFLP